MANALHDRILQLSDDERADLALLLWESLGEEMKTAHFTLDEEQRAELDRRWALHLAEPESALRWDDLERSLRSAK